MDSRRAFGSDSLDHRAQQIYRAKSSMLCVASSIAAFLFRQVFECLLDIGANRRVLNEPPRLIEHAYLQTGIAGVVNMLIHAMKHVEQQRLKQLLDTTRIASKSNIEADRRTGCPARCRHSRRIGRHQPSDAAELPRREGAGWKE